MADLLHSLLANLSIAFDATGRRFADMAHARKLRLMDRAAKRGRDREIHPLGYWRCTHVREKFPEGFVAGGIYEDRHEPAGTVSIRIIPADHDSWSPYWNPWKGRFCYEARDIDFEYLGASLPEGEACLTSERTNKTA